MCTYRPFYTGQVIPSLVLTVLLSAMLHACKKDEPDPAPFSFESVSGLVISETGEKLLATDAGLCSLDVASGSYVEMDNQLSGTSLNDLVYSFTAPEKELWLASHEGASNYTAGFTLNKANSAIQSDQVNQIGFNPDNTAFFGSPDGLSILSGENWSAYAGLDDFFLLHEISDIASTSDGYTYVTTYGGGIERFKAGLDGISGATLMDSDWTLLESNYVNSVFTDDTIQVYGTNQGVGFHFSEYTKWDWEVYTTGQGLVNDTVLSVARDHSGNWWIGTADGISMFDESRWVSFTLDEYDLTGRRVKYLAVDADGSVWIATDQGLSHFSDGTWRAYPVSLK